MAGGQKSSGSPSTWPQMMQSNPPFGYAAAAYQYGMMQSAYGYQWPTGAAAVNAQYGMMQPGYAMPTSMPMYGYGTGYPQQVAAGSAMGNGCGSGSGSGGSSSSSAKGSGAASLLEELKAKQAVREEKKRLQEQIDECSEKDQGRKVLLQYKLGNLEQSLWMMGDSAGSASDGAWLSSSSSAAASPLRRFRPPEDGRNDQFGRLIHVLVQFLRSRDGQSALGNQLLSERSVQTEWDDLLRSRVVDKTTRIEEVLRSRPNVFEVSLDRRDVVTVRLSQEGDEAASRQGGGRELAVVALEGERVLAIEAYLKKAGGSEQVARLEALFGVKKQQLSKHFTLYEDRKKMYAAPLTGLARQASLAALSGLEAELKDLEQILRNLTPSRGSIAEAMAFCVDRGDQHAAPLARRLMKALEEPDLKTRTAISRLYLVSDVLYNANSGVKGAARYRTSFQELLPGACERLGRHWLQRLSRGRLEWERARDAVHAVLGAWRAWGVFPQLFVRGLEALLFAPLPSEGSDGSSDASDEDEADGTRSPEILRRRLARWRGAGAETSRLTFAARLRGLSGASLPASECAVRLCHYERYWCRRGNPDEFDPIEEPSEARAAAAAARSAAALREAAAEDIDGESLSDGDESLLQEVEVSAPASMWPLLSGLPSTPAPGGGVAPVEGLPAMEAEPSSSCGPPLKRRRSK